MRARRLVVVLVCCSACSRELAEHTALDAALNDTSLGSDVVQSDAAADEATAIPRSVFAALTPRTMSLGTSHTCAIRVGAVYCWGYAARGALGIGSLQSETPRRVSGIENAIEIATGPGDSGALHSCVRTLDREVWCWGDNQYGQLGDGTQTDRTVPLLVSGLEAVEQIAVGDRYSCALTSEGRVFCWGDVFGGMHSSPREVHFANRVRILASERSEPIVVTDDEQFYDYLVPLAPRIVPSGTVEVRAGSMHRCLRTNSGRVFCWGINTHGQLGNGSSEQLTNPTLVEGINDAVGLFVARDGTCVVHANQQLSCWGYIPVGDPNEAIPGLMRPTAVRGATAIVALAGGEYHFCYSTIAEVFCWGVNHSGQLGNGTTRTSYTPTRVLGW